MSTRRTYAQARQLAREIAEGLETLFGNRPSITWLEHGGLKVSVRVGEIREPALTEAVISLLDRGDRFGHRYSERSKYVWSEVDFAGPEDETEQGAP